MLIEAKTEKDGKIVNKYEVHLECTECGMNVDAEEYKSGTCSDCGAAWNGKKHTAVHVTSVPASGQTS
jgi:Zn finger protein HypA/HybF involved in hydrogenase expression